ncbi:hypothetical protein EYB53_016610 [Candidatus Chloroploca sp. M-50]|uniref:CRISPR-associated protein Cas5 n=1 Tax=Candidatus Chloroploca mongolica TaxID=2528176 RepID=A0ABS4DD14_9CHLR|nr:hypothetical protein [Candidatus Chloroploca mongolica]MBP1467336.1 hypothetical protein [Candidatus Chloroploca mongolica]
MWIYAVYQPVALFSLKPAMATSSGGKTLLCPTPFALKMALLDAALRTQGLAAGERLWPLIRDMRLQIALPSHIVVINTFTKIVRPKKGGSSDDNGSGLLTPLGNTIAYREYVNYSGQFALALQPVQSKAAPSSIIDLLTQINYFGKRGGFVQLMQPPKVYDNDDLPSDQKWVMLTEDQPAFQASGTLQMLDDCGSKLSFEQVNIYSSKRITLGKDRLLRHIVLPYRLERSSRGFSMYTQIAMP